MSDFLTAARERVVIYDGAIGHRHPGRRTSPPTTSAAPTSRAATSCSCVTRPDVIAGLHAAYFEVGVDVVETDTFGCLRRHRSPSTASPTGPTRSTGRRPASPRRWPTSYATPDRPRWVAGSIGPGTKFPSLGQIRFAELRDAYEVQARGLLEGGVDLLIIETQFDLLGAQGRDDRRPPGHGRDRARGAAPGAGHHGAHRPHAARHRDRRRAGRHRRRCGPTSSASTAPPARPRWASTSATSSQHARMPISCLPNAGLPSVVDGQMHYDLTPDQLAEYHAPLRHRARRRASSAAAAAPRPSTSPPWSTRCRDLDAAPPRTPSHEAGATSIYSLGAVRAGHLVPDHRRAHQRQRLQEVPRGHARGRLGHVRRRWPSDQVKEGAHVLDVCVDYVGRDGAADMDEIASASPPRRACPLVLDSTEPPGHRGRPAVDRRPGHPQLGQPRGRRGRGHAASTGSCQAGRGVRRRRHLPAHRRGGPGPRRRVEAAGRPPHPRPRRRPLRPRAERPDLRRARPSRSRPATTTCAATASTPSRPSAASRPSCPACYTTLGLSNVSFGLKPAARHVLNSVFLHECVEAGLDSAIVHAARIMPLNRIPERAARGLPSTSIYDRARATTTTRCRSCSTCSRTSTPAEVEKEDRTRLDRRAAAVSQRIIDGDRDGLEADLDEAMAGGHHPARHHQRRAARRHEGRRRAVRLRPDAAAVRAAVGRDDEGGGRLPRAAHGEGRLRRQGPHRAGHGQGRRPRHRQEPRRHHPHQQRLRGAQPRHQGARSPR